MASSDLKGQGIHILTQKFGTLSRVVISHRCPMGYSKPVQKRAIETELRFLNALNDCLSEQSFESTSIDEIARRAGLHRGAFLKRFGSKRQALLVLFARYCDRATSVIQNLQNDLERHPSVESVCIEMSKRLEEIQMVDFGANRAMHEDFLNRLETNELTKRIFSETVDLMRLVQRKFLPPGGYTEQGAFAATQLLVTINFNHTLRAMPALPQDHEKRHRLISQCMCAALHY